MGESRSYIWFDEDKLGSGATASVYKCRHKESGDLFAVKVLNNRTPTYINKRECDILKAAKHENVVALLAVEQENSLRSQVIIMEYCNEGSLQGFISKTENAYGMCEKDLLAVLHDLVSGVKYLRSKNIAHRDIKPLNILRTIRDDGVAVHKLADFGASRILTDNERFESIVGTEEYLHPDVYSHVFNAGTMYRQKHGFKPTVDLWSIGVTMYYCITGSLPFNAFEGRNDRDTMFRIISERMPDKISGVQERSHGPIVWSSEYPVECRAPKELLNLLLPIQRGLFETADDRAWSFDSFFDKITDVLKRRKIQAVDVFCTMLHNLYLPEDSSLADIQRAVSEITSIPTADLLLLCNNMELDSYATSVSFGDQGSLQHTIVQPNATAAGPLFVFSRSNGAGRKPRPMALLRVNFRPQMQPRDAIGAVQRMHFAAQEAAETLGLINSGMLALLAHQRRTLMARKDTLDRSPLAGTSGEHRLRALCQLSSGTAQFRDLLLHFTRVLFFDTPYEVYNKDMTLSDLIPQWEKYKAEVQICADEHNKLARELLERNEDAEVVQKWKEAASNIAGFNDDVSRIQRLCGDLVQQEQTATKNKASLVGNSTKSRYNKKLFDADCERVRKLYGKCGDAMARFVDRLTTWTKEVHEPYTANLERVVRRCDDLAGSHEALMNQLDSVTNKKDEIINDILTIVIDVSGKLAAANGKPDWQSTTGSSAPGAAASGAAAASCPLPAGGQVEAAAGHDSAWPASSPQAEPLLSEPRRASSECGGSPLQQQPPSNPAQRSLQRFEALKSRIQRETESALEESRRVLDQT